MARFTDFIRHTATQVFSRGQRALSAVDAMLDRVFGRKGVSDIPLNPPISTTDADGRKVLAKKFGDLGTAPLSDRMAAVAQLTDSERREAFLGALEDVGTSIEASPGMRRISERLVRNRPQDTRSFLEKHMDKMERKLRNAFRVRFDPVGDLERKLAGIERKWLRLGSRLDDLFGTEGNESGALRDPSPISRERVEEFQRAIERYINKRNKIGADWLRRYEKGEIDLDTLKLQLQDNIIRLHTAATVLGSGGLGNLSENHMAILDRKVAEQFRYLDGFIDKLRAMGASGKKISPKEYARLKLYSEAARGTARQAQRQFVVNEAGDEAQERRVTECTRGVEENCSDCPAYEALGWVPVGELPPIGDSECGMNCACCFEYRVKPDRRGGVDFDEE